MNVSLWNFDAGSFVSSGPTSKRGLVAKSQAGDGQRYTSPLVPHEELSTELASVSAITPEIPGCETPRNRGGIGSPLASAVATMKLRARSGKGIASYDPKEDGKLISLIGAARECTPRG